MNRLRRFAARAARQADMRDSEQQQLWQALADAGDAAVGHGVRRPFLWLAVFLLTGAVLLSLYYPLRSRDYPQDDVARHFAGMVVTVDGRQKIDLNAADLSALQTLPGIGIQKAGAILAWRAAHGPFTSLEQLLEVEGIGPKTLEQLRDQLIVIGTDQA